MSKITTVFNAIVTEVGTLFPTKTRIRNPYSLTDNSQLFLRNGWGLKVGPSSPSEFQEFCSKSVDQVFTIVFTRELIGIDPDAMSFDDESLAFLEDVESVRNLLYSYNELNIEASIQKVEMGEGSGVQQATVESFKFLSFEVNFTFTISEPQT